jgi:hypothetical protein
VVCLQTLGLADTKKPPDGGIRRQRLNRWTSDSQSRRRQSTSGGGTAGHAAGCATQGRWETSTTGQATRQAASSLATAHHIGPINHLQQALWLPLRGLGEEVIATGHDFGADDALFAIEFFDGDAAVIATDDDDSTGPGAAGPDLTGKVGIPLGCPAYGCWIFIDHGHVALGGVGLTGGHGPVVFSWHQGLAVVGGLADVVVRVHTGRAAEDALIGDNLFLDHEAEGIIGGLRQAACEWVRHRVRILTVVVLGELLEREDDLLAVADTFHLIALSLDHGEGGHGQARENRDDRDHHQQLDQSEGVVSFRFHWRIMFFLGWL